MVIPVAFGPNRHVHDDALVVVAPILAFYHLARHRIARFRRCCGSWLLGAKVGADELSVFEPDSEARVLEVNVHDGRIGRCEFYFAFPLTARTGSGHCDRCCRTTRDQFGECGEALLIKSFAFNQISCNHSFELVNLQLVQTNQINGEDILVNIYYRLC